MLQLGIVMVIVGFPEQWEAAEGTGYPEETEKLPREKALMTTLYLLYDFACESPWQEAQSSCSINIWVNTPIPLDVDLL